MKKESFTLTLWIKTPQGMKIPQRWELLKVYSWTSSLQGPRKMTAHNFTKISARHKSPQRLKTSRESMTKSRARILRNRSCQRLKSDLGATKMTQTPKTPGLDFRIWQIKPRIRWERLLTQKKKIRTSKIQNSKIFRLPSREGKSREEQSVSSWKSIQTNRKSSLKQNSTQPWRIPRTPSCKKKTGPQRKA